MDWTPANIRAVRTYIGRRTGLYGHLLDDAVADGLLALVERGDDLDLRASKCYAFRGAVDAHRRRFGRRAYVPPDRLEVVGHGVADRYPSEADTARIVEWARGQPPRTRRIVWHVLCGYTFVQAGRFEGVSPSRVSQIMRAKGRPNLSG